MARSSSMNPSLPAGVVRTATSRALRALRASPSATLARWRRASSAARMLLWPSPRSGSFKARRSNCIRSSSERGCNSKICERETSGELMKKKGLWVVAPMSRTIPASTSGNNTSCCALLKRWISSMNRMVDWPLFAKRLAAPESTRRISATFDSTPLNRSNLFFVWRAMIWASDVLPVPGGP